MPSLDPALDFSTSSTPSNPIPTSSAAAPPPAPPCKPPPPTLPTTPPSPPPLLLRRRLAQVFFAGLALGLLAAGLGVGLGLGGRAGPTQFVASPPLPFPLPRFFQNLTLPEAGPWSYTHSPDTGRGPTAWGTVRDPATGALLFPACGGAQQAPIALSTAGAARVAGAARLHRAAENATNFTMLPREDFHPGFHFVLRGAGQAASWRLAGTDGVEREYGFTEFHFHSPAEHVLDGVTHPLEAHFLYEVPATATAPALHAAFGVLFPWAPEGPDNAFIRTFWSNVYFREPRNVSGRVDLAGFMDAVGPALFRFDGSLTSPPCSPAKWYVGVASSGVSTRQWAEFAVSNGLVDNARPVQPLGGRTVELLTLGSPVSVGR